MSVYITVLSFIVVILLLVSLGYTFYVTKQQKELKGEYDGPIPDSVKSHPYLRNPIFLSMLIATVLILMYIVYLIAK
ncbi:hypothetical protein WAK64_02575 [Bacillus spongiae]|uniref:Short-chain dehydrogenase n=1 Tax=Bacillus spongiae TaxID=2683610 RepID=A0ABU8H9W9_9BACI